MTTDYRISIDKGRTGVIKIILETILELEDLLFKFIAAEKIGDDPIIELEGILESDYLTILFEYKYDTTSELDAKQYYYEIIIYKEDKSYIQTVNHGLLQIVDVIQVDPTI